MTIRESGWTINERELKDLSGQTDPVGWDLRYSYDDQPNDVLYDTVSDNLEADFPTIVGVDPAYLRNRGIDGGHAVVASGLTPDEVVINDPWGSAYEMIDQDRFADAWDIRGSMLITIDLASGSNDSDATVREIE